MLASPRRTCRVIVAPLSRLASSSLNCFADLISVCCPLCAHRDDHVALADVAARLAAHLVHHHPARQAQVAAFLPRRSSLTTRPSRLAATSAFLSPGRALAARGDAVVRDLADGDRQRPWSAPCARPAATAFDPAWSSPRSAAGRLERSTGLPSNLRMMSLASTPALLGRAALLHRRSPARRAACRGRTSRPAPSRPPGSPRRSARGSRARRSRSWF